jgi:hypothetical protein
MSTKITLPSGQSINVQVDDVEVEEVREGLQAFYPELVGAVGTKQADGSIVFARPVGGTKG